MRTRHLLRTAALLGSVLLFAPAASAIASDVFAPPGGQPVNVNIGFNSHLPLPDGEEATIMEAQRSAREFLYRTSREECVLLQATIAKTCRLTNLNINTQIQQQNPSQPMIYINGNASYSITLKAPMAGKE